MTLDGVGEEPVCRDGISSVITKSPCCLLLALFAILEGQLET